jgi:hypothetical protein
MGEAESEGKMLVQDVRGVIVAERPTEPVGELELYDRGQELYDPGRRSAGLDRFIAIGGGIF